jgi:predicted ABC-type ATPase
VASKKPARPVMIVIAGPPGSGKSTFFPIGALGVDAFGIDDRCAQIVGSYRAIPAAVRKAVSQECERFVAEHVERGASFAVETTMRTLVSARQAEQARTKGFRTALTFLGTTSPDINVERVLQRAQAGGHAASEGEIRAIYTAALGNLADAVRAFDRSRILDSSESWKRPRLVARVTGGRIAFEPGAPPWATTALGADSERD